MSGPRLVAVCGASDATDAEAVLAAEVGRLVVGRGLAVVCGGLGGVMAAVARGAAEGGGLCIGLLPGEDRAGAAAGLAIALPTGMGEMRNTLLVRVAEGVVAIGGGYGTLSEIGLARRIGRPVALLASWGLSAPARSRAPAVDADLWAASTPAEAVDWLVGRIGA